MLRNAEELTWQALDPGKPSGDQKATLFGDPETAAIYSFRLKLKGGPGGGRPHWHPDYEFGTVLSGSYLVATGARLSRDDAKRLGPGAFIVIPPHVRHATWAEEDVVLQIHGPGPRVTKFD